MTKETKIRGQKFKDKTSKYYVTGIKLMKIVVLNFRLPNLYE